MNFFNLASITTIDWPWWISLGTQIDHYVIKSIIYTGIILPPSEIEIHENSRTENVNENKKHNLIKTIYFYAVSFT